MARVCYCRCQLPFAVSCQTRGCPLQTRLLQHLSKAVRQQEALSLCMCLYHTMEVFSITFCRYQARGFYACATAAQYAAHVQKLLQQPPLLCLALLQCALHAIHMMLMLSDSCSQCDTSTAYAPHIVALAAAVACLTPLDQKYQQT